MAYDLMKIGYVQTLADAKTHISKIADRETFVVYNESKLYTKLGNKLHETSENLYIGASKDYFFDEQRFLKLPNDFTSKLPCNFWRNSNNDIQHNMDFAQYKGGTEIYVDLDNGNDITGDGSESLPYKTITQASNIAEVGIETSYLIKVVSDSAFFRDEARIDIEFGEKIIAIVAENTSGKVIITNGQRGLTWTLYSENTYYTTRSTTSQIVDFETVDDDGNTIPYIGVESITECEVTEGSWYTDGTLVYVHRFDGEIPTESNTAVCLMATNIDVDLLENGVFYMENVNIMTGLPAKINGDSSLLNQTGTFVVNSCFLSCGNDIFGNETNGDSLLVDSIKNTYIFNSISSYAKRDCFNYHFTTVSDVKECFVLEVNCKSKNGGRGSLETNNNNTTCHEGTNILRINGDYSDSPIPVIDVGNCYSILIDCKAYDSTIGNGDFRFYDDNGTGKVFIVNCVSKSKIGLNSDVETYVYNFTGNIEDTGYQNILSVK